MFDLLPVFVFFFNIKLPRLSLATFTFGARQEPN